MNCIHCHKPIELVPSAAERARKFGGVPSDYTALFTYHAACTLKLRSARGVRSAKSSVINIYSGERHGLVI